MVQLKFSFKLHNQLKQELNRGIVLYFYLKLYLLKNKHYVDFLNNTIVHLLSIMIVLI
jgi:hypothetical protein